jgi:hypothetical protein
MHLVTAGSPRHTTGVEGVLQIVKGGLQAAVLVAAEPTWHLHASEEVAAFSKARGTHFDKLSAGVLCEVLGWRPMQFLHIRLSE